MLATNVEKPKYVVLGFAFLCLLHLSLPSSRDVFVFFSLSLPAENSSKTNCFIVADRPNCFWFLHRNVSATCISSTLNSSPDCLICLAILLNIIYILCFVLPFSGILLNENFHFLSWPCLAGLFFLLCLIWLMSKKPSLHVFSWCYTANCIS